MHLKSQKAPTQRPEAAQILRRFAAWSAALLLVGCAIPGGPRSSGPADWQAMAMSWEKLDTIELWLEGSGARASIPERLEGELTLAEGRLAFAKSDHDRDPGAPVDARLQSATRGFEKILASKESDFDQRARAEAGLSAAALVRVLPASSPVPTRIIARALWGAAAGVPIRMTAASQNWRRITIHHTATESGYLAGAPISSVAAQLRTFQGQHMSTAVEGGPWGDIGYHYLIDPDGRMYEGRRLKWQGAHATGSNNVDNIGVCLIGHFALERPTPRALNALESLLLDLQTKYRIPRSELYGHQHFKNTECPGTHLARWLAQYKAGHGNLSMAR